MSFNFLAAGRTSSCILFLLNKTRKHSSRHHVYRNYFFFCKHSFSSTAITSGDDDRVVDSLSSSPTISYLIQNCGLSMQSALSVSKKLELKFPKKSDYVLQVLKDYGFTDAHITALVIKCPRILLVKVDLYLKPKLEYFFSEGFTDLQVLEVLLSCPRILSSNLERKIIPSITFIKTILPTNAALIQFIKHASNLSPPVWLANIETLRSNGVPDDIIRKMCTTYPRCLSRNPDWFAKSVEKTMNLGIEPSNVSLFAKTIRMLSYMKQSTWERRLKLFKSFGWSNEEILLVFKRQPNCFEQSEILMKNKMVFITQKLGYSSRRLISNTKFLTLSLEKRIIPRCSVLSVLIGKGLIKTISLQYLFMPTKKFVDKFVQNHKDQVPEVVDAYNGKLGFNGLFPKWWYK